MDNIKVGDRVRLPGTDTGIEDDFVPEEFGVVEGLEVEHDVCIVRVDVPLEKGDDRLREVPIDMIEPVNGVRP